MMFNNDSIDQEFAKETSTSAQDSPETQPDPEPTVPEDLPFPTDCLPSGLGDMVREVARIHQVPETLTGPCALAALSACLGRNLRVASRPNRTTMGNLYMLITAESGVGKSSVCATLMQSLHQCEEEADYHWEEEIKPRALAEYELLEAEVANLKKSKPGARPDGEMERRDSMDLIRQKRKRQQELKQDLIPPRLMVENITSEALSTVLANNDETIFSCSADASDVFGVLRGNYKKDGSDENIYLKGWSGDHIKVDRVNREPVSLAHPCISVLWLTQPQRLEELFHQKAFVEGGLLPRFMLCHSGAQPMALHGDPAPVDETIQSTYSNLLCELLWAYRKDKQEKIIATLPEARLRLDQYHNEIVARRASGELSEVGVFAARWGEWAWRLSVVLHAARWGNEAHENPLEVTTASEAVRLADWFSRRQLRLLEWFREQAAQEQAELIRGLLRKHPTGVTPRILQRASSRFNALEATKVLEGLVSRGYLLRKPTPAGARGRPTMAYITGPRI